MALPVVIKGGKNYITLVLDSDMEFSSLLQKIVEKFIESQKFFKDEPIAIMFEGRSLSDSEQCIILDAIAEFTTVNITNILDYSEFTNAAATLLQKAIDETNKEIDEIDSTECLFISHGISSGERIESDNTIIIQGDVEVGAIVRSSKDIIVLGSLYGQAIAGIHDNEEASIMALDFEPENFRIGSTLGASLKKRKYKTSLKNKVAKKAQKAFIKDGVIHIEQLFK